MSWVIAILVLSLLVFLVWASADVGSRVYVNALCRTRTGKKQIALSFDDGPDADMTPRVLDVLRRHGVKATFFLVGSKVGAQPNIVRRMVAEGHTVANHGYSHQWHFPLSPYRTVRQELERCRDAIAEVTGKRTRLFRPPFGVTNPTIGRAVRKLGLHCIGWSIRSLDTRGESPEVVLKRVSAQWHAGAVLLLHDRCRHADILLEKLLLDLRQHGYAVVPLDQLLNIEAYEK